MSHRIRVLLPALPWRLLLLLLVTIAASARAADPAGSLADRDVRFRPQHLDREAEPCTDFFRYANGGWLDENPIPADRSRWSAYDQLSARTEGEIGELLRAAADDVDGSAPQSAQWKVGVLYGSCMDVERRRGLEGEALTRLLRRVRAVTGRDSLATELGRWHRLGLDVPFSLSAVTDPDDSTRRIAQLWQGGLGLPVASWYALEGEEATELRNAYAGVIEEAFRRAGLGGQATRMAADVLAFEARLAASTMPRSETRDPGKVNHRLTRAELETSTPGFDWTAYFGGLGLEPPARFLVGQPEYLRLVADLAQQQAPGVWRAYLTWSLLRRVSGFMIGDLARTSQELRGLYSGTTEPPPPERSCGEFMDFALGEVVGQMWARRTFSREAKQYAERMAADLVAALEDRIRDLEWMGPSTRREALAKLERLEIRIGYPDQPPEHEGLRLDRGAAFLDHVVQVSTYRVARDLARVDRPIDRSWGLLPQSITGGYIPSWNVIEYPAAKFRPPFFALDRDDALNYGALGSTLAHEILHALDDEGRHYDAAGNLRDWWTADDAGSFDSRAARLAEQFDEYTVLEGLPVDGRLTLGENIADLGGVSLAWEAFRRSSLGKQPSPAIDGLTASQRFFLGWAIAFRGHLRPERQRAALERDVHAPLRWRVNGVMRNLPEFAEAYGCDIPGEDAIVRVW